VAPHDFYGLLGLYHDVFFDAPHAAAGRLGTKGSATPSCTLMSATQKLPSPREVGPNWQGHTWANASVFGFIEFLWDPFHAKY
jgi:hypothetical protein